MNPVSGLILFVVFLSCTETDFTETCTELRYYDLTEPVLETKLPFALREISGHDIDPDGLFYAIEDESGVLFDFDPLSGEINQRTRFAPRNDFEAIIAVTADSFMVLRSDGTIFCFNTSNETEAVKIKTGLDSSNDTEGMCLYETGLLIACKEKPHTKDKKKKREIVFFDLKSMEIDPDRSIWIDISELRDRLDRKKFNFKPSAIRIHPFSGELYILSSNDQSILVCSPDGEVKALCRIDPALLAQPEGIAFDTLGNMYISSEAASDLLPSKIMKFEYTPQ